MTRKKLDRREFIKRGSAQVVTAGMVLSGLQGGLARAAEEAEPTVKVKGFRPLGKTGLQVSELSIGAMEVTNPQVILRALEHGCNYIDTARTYQRGRNEVMLGQLMPDIRKRKGVILASKFHSRYTDPRATKADYIGSVEESLRSLKTDCIDIVQVHGVDRGSLGVVNNPELKAAFEELKQAGKARFLGVTTHSDMALVLEEVIKAGFYHTVLVYYNIYEREKLNDVLTKARKAGLGLVAMKVLKPYFRQRRRGEKPAEKTPAELIRGVLQNQDITTACIGMWTFEEVREDVAAVASPEKA